jgi:hypothetical protein
MTMPAPILLLRGAAMFALAAVLSGCLRNEPGVSSASGPNLAARDSKQRIRSWWTDSERLALATRHAFDRVRRAAKHGNVTSVDTTIASTQRETDAARYRVTSYVPAGLDDASNDLFTAFSEYETALNLVAESGGRDARASLASASAHASAADSALRSASRETLAQYVRAGGRKGDIAAI